MPQIHAHSRSTVSQLASPARTSKPSEHERIINQAEKWVAQTFFGTLLKQMRDSPFRSKIFEGGRGGEAFGSLYDQHLADHMARGAGRKLVNAIANRIEARKAYGKSTKRPGRSRDPHGLTPSHGSNHVSAAWRA